MPKRPRCRPIRFGSKRPSVRRSSIAEPTERGTTMPSTIRTFMSKMETTTVSSKPKTSRLQQAMDMNESVWPSPRMGPHWEKLLDPIIDVGTSGSWDSIARQVTGGGHQIWGTVLPLLLGAADETGKRIGFATADEITGPWVKCDENPVISGRSDSWDRYLSTYPAPLFKRRWPVPSAFSWHDLLLSK